MKLAGVKKSKVESTIEKITNKGKFIATVRSRHPSHDPLRNWFKSKSAPRFGHRVVIRLGSEYEYAQGSKRVEINTVNAVKNTSDKFRTKVLLNQANVPTAEAIIYRNGYFYEVGNSLNVKTKAIVNDDSFPMIGKIRKGSRGNGLVLIETKSELESFVNNFDFFKEQMNLNSSIVIGSYIFEKYHNYSREYRIHLSESGVIYTNRKMLKSDTPDDQRFYRNDKNCVWYVESNPKFDKPVNWDKIIEECQKARRAVGIDICAIDLKIQSSKSRKGTKRKDPKFFIVELNSAPSFGEGTLEAYKEALPDIINSKM